MNKPCADPANDPNDWFISRDGKQYPDDALVSQVEIDALRTAMYSSGEHTLEEFEAEVNRLETVALKDALRRRRHALDKCHSDCYSRLQCLDFALQSEQAHGTWGGYTEEELRQLRAEVARRKRAR